MKQLYEEITRNSGKNAPCLIKHMKAAGIEDWNDLSKSNLFALRDTIKDAVSPNSAKTYLAQIRAILARFSEDVELPKGWEGIFRQKAEKPVRAFLNKKELGMLEAVRTKTPEEKIVKVQSLLEAYTGARVSDIMRLTEENIRDGYLTYTSKKTSVTANIPVSEKTKGWIIYAQDHREDEPKSLMQRNRVIRRLLKRAGICSKTKVYEAGEEQTGPKYQFISSHSFRISAASNLSLAGASLFEIKQCLGHTNTAMTERYIAVARPALSAKAMAYFGV